MNEARPYASLSSGLLARKGSAKPAMRPQGFGQGYGNLEDLGWNDMGQAPEPGPAPAPAEHVPSSIAALTPAPKIQRTHPDASYPDASYPDGGEDHEEGEEGYAGEEGYEGEEAWDGAEAHEAEQAFEPVQPEPVEPEAVEPDFTAAEPAEAEQAFEHDHAFDPVQPEDEAFAPPEPIEPEPVAEPASFEAPPVIAQQRAILERFDGEEELSPDPAASAPAEVVPLPARQSAAERRKAAFTLRLDSERHLRLRLACAVSGRSAQQIVARALDEALASIPEIEALASQVPGKPGRAGKAKSR